MPLMLPQEIAEKMTPMEFIRLHSVVEKKFRQEFGVVSITHKGNKFKVVVELADNTQHTVEV